METATATHVRILLADEFARPPGWPEDVGVAVVRTRDPEAEIFPIHRLESSASLLRRIGDLSGIAFDKAAVYPPVEGHPECDLPFSTVRSLVSGVEEFLAANPGAVEEADDFAVNFTFATEEGIDVSSAVAESTYAPHAASAVLPGYAPIAPGAARKRPFAKAVLRIDADGNALVILDPSAPTGEIATPEVLVRNDGIGFAVHRQAVKGGSHHPYALRLPHGSLPEALEGFECEIPLVSSERDDHLLFTPLPGLAQRRVEPSLSFGPTHAEPAPSGVLRALEARLTKPRLRGFGVATGVAMFLTMVFISTASTRALPPDSPVDALRASLFQVEP